MGNPEVLGYLHQVEGLQQLTQLTLLELEGWRLDTDKVQLLLQQPLPLQVLRFFNAYYVKGLDLSCLTQLKEFSNLHSDGQGGAVFPPQLEQLSVGDPLHDEEQFEAVLQLQQLQRLAFTVGVGKPDLLLRLAQMPSLQQLSLRYGRGSQDRALAGDTAAAWPQLSQLRELELDLGLLECSPGKQQREAICRSLAASTGLTKLKLEGAHCLSLSRDKVVGHTEARMYGFSVCGMLAGLTNLQNLCLQRSHLLPGDALALTALTGLTRLELRSVGAGVGDQAATVIASSCKQLQHLDLSYCELGGVGCLAVVHYLTQLTGLRLQGNDAVTQQSLNSRIRMMLTGLEQLQQLGVDMSEQVADDIMDRLRQ
jgi:hypothetical protein